MQQSSLAEVLLRLLWLVGGIAEANREESYVLWTVNVGSNLIHFG
jgi:hypothetical protein